MYMTIIEKNNLKKLIMSAKIFKNTTKKKEEKVIFTVEDNGAGIPENKTDTLLQTGTSGYGIKNVNDRIQLLYGSAYGITIHSREGQGTKVEICIPVENSTKK